MTGLGKMLSKAQEGSDAAWQTAVKASNKVFSSPELGILMEILGAVDS